MVATNPSGLQATTFYYFKVNGTEFSILTPSPAPTYQQVADLMDAATTASGFEVKITGTAPNQDIRVRNFGVKGWDSFVTLAYGTSGPNLWINLTGFVAFDPAVPGRGAFELGYIPGMPTGGSTLSGAAATTYSTIGGIIISGHSPEVVNVTPAWVASGTITIGGTGFYRLGFTYIVSGGIVMAGAGLYEKGLFYVAHGGIVMGGAGLYISSKSYVPTGTITIGGAGLYIGTLQLSYIGSGTATFAGTSTTSQTKIYSYIMVPGTGGEAGSLHRMDAETADTSQWSSLQTTGGTITADAAALDHGSYGYKYLANGSSPLLAAIRNVNNLVDVYVRIYFNLYNFQSSYGTVDWLAVRYGTQRIAELQIKRRTGYCGYALLLDTGSGLTTVADHTSEDIFADNTWYYVELHWRRRVYDGGLEFWINGASQYSNLTLNTTNVPYSNSVRVGQLNLPAQTNGSTIYVDDALVDDNYIGAYTATTKSPLMSGAGVYSQPKEYLGLYYGTSYYPFDSMGGTTAYDKFVAANHLTLSSSDVWYGDAKFYGSVKFDKGHWSTLTADVAPMAISFWHKWKIDNQNSYRVLGASADDLRWYFAFEPGYFRAVIRNNTAFYTFANAGNYFIPPDDDQWHWYYIDFYSGSNAQLYVDNVYRGQVTSFFNTNTYKLHTIGNGGDDGVSGVYGFGPLDDLRIYTTYRLTSAQRALIFTQSPYPGGVIISGSAQVQPVLIAGEIYDYTMKGGITLKGSRYTYVVKSTAITLGGTAPHIIQYNFTGSGSALAEGASAFHDFGLGYVYDIVTGGVTMGGAATTTHTRNYLYFPTGLNAIEIISHTLYAIIIEGSYIIVFQEVGQIKISGAAITEGIQIIAITPTGGIAMTGTSGGAVIGKVAPIPTGKGTLSGTATYSWAPNSGYQELGL